jgi:hypothetical protein
MIGETIQKPIAVRGSFGNRTDKSLRTAIDGMSDPQIAEWKLLGEALWSENNNFSEEAQGIGFEAGLWYVSSNGAKAIGIYSGGQRTGELAPTAKIWQQMQSTGYTDQHFGALAINDGWAFVPIQHPHGIWRTRLDGSQQSFYTPDITPDGNMFPWCAIHPVTGRLYTSSYDSPSFVRAYDAMTLKYTKEDDIRLQKISMFVDRVQGAVFSPRGRLILVRSGYNAVFSYSGLNGHCFGSRQLGDFGHSGSEVEAVVVTPWQINRVPTPVHILELDNDLVDPDDFHLHSYSVPKPAQI